MSTTTKAGQAAYYDHGVANPEFEISRPHGESKLYEYLMDFKFDHAIRLLRQPLEGKDVLDLCCGSGMDAEYLVRAGARVVAMDISSGCLWRARMRGERFGLDYALVRADAENLPFADQSFDYAFVHDGLHHLPAPDRAVTEMARVARHGIVVMEPADARLTKLLIWSRLLSPYEEAGNFVLRFHPQRLEGLCRSLGFDRIAASRYLVKYGHPPARWWSCFNPEPLFALARAAFLLFGVKLLSRWGNKLAFVAERSSGGAPGALL